ncbi:hypothetical protein [Aureivirga sp. CE67]|uniref:hypothetical protein n=1 Tax=Aureivirga sp. CE67 TaxID=1788983 RepID=UPI0018C99D8D|nr:hypothetical protein [Aureivirga sp. CE67]
MTTRKISILIIIVLFIVVLVLPNFNFPIKNKDLIGTYIEDYYVSLNSDHTKIRDTLILRENGLISSNYFGNGSYKFTKPDRITLIPETGKDAMTYTVNLTNIIFQPITIELSNTVDWHRYEKIKSN